MSIIVTRRAPTQHRRDGSESASLPIDFLTARDCRSAEIDESTERIQLEQAVRKATAQLRRSVRLSNPLEDGLYSLISGRRVSPSSGRSFACRVSRCHQRN